MTRNNNPFSEIPFVATLATPYLCGMMAGLSEHIQATPNNHDAIEHAVLVNPLFWRGYLDVASTIRFKVATRNLERYPHMEIRAPRFLRLALCQFFAENKQWHDNPEDTHRAQFFKRVYLDKFTLTGGFAKALLELTHGEAASLFSSNNIAIIEEILDWVPERQDAFSDQRSIFVGGANLFGKKDEAT